MAVAPFEILESIAGVDFTLSETRDKSTMLLHYSVMDDRLMTSREIDQATYQLIRSIVLNAPIIAGTNGNRDILHDEIKRYYLEELPPVDVVATKPTGAAAGNNAKILLLVVGVAAALILFNK